MTPQLAQRLSSRRLEDPQRYTLLTDMAAAEKAAGQHVASDSCAKGLLWLVRCVRAAWKSALSNCCHTASQRCVARRAMTLMVELVSSLLQRPKEELHAAIKQAYAKVLQPYHGWIAYAAFQVRLRDAC